MSKRETFEGEKELRKRLNDALASEREYREMHASRMERLRELEKKAADLERLRENCYHNLAQEYHEVEAHLYRVRNRIHALGFRAPDEQDASKAPGE